MKTTKSYLTGCHFCGATGVVQNNEYNPISTSFTTTKICPACNGSGTITVTEVVESDARLQELILTDEEIQKWAKEVVIKKEDNYSGLDYMILAAKWARNKLTGK